MSVSDGSVVEMSMTDPSQFALIFDRHVDPVRRFVSRRLGADRADDVVSEVFRIAFERRGSFEMAALTALPWLYGIAVNLVRREHRGQARWVAALARADGRRDIVGDPFLDAAARLDARSGRAALVDALLALRDEERDVLLLVAWEQLGPAEVGAVLGIPAATARSRLHRARIHIRSHLENGGSAREVISDAY